MLGIRIEIVTCRGCGAVDRERELPPLVADAG
jgi:hypothetical protein